jgi:hypothetical protein
MSEPKPFASLTSGLLARKGGARPAMRRQLALGDDGHTAGQDDLGWNDMGEGENYAAQPMPMTGLTPMPTHGAAPVPTPNLPAAKPIPHVIEERRELAEKVAVPVPTPVEPAVQAAAVAPLTRKAKAAFTLRLDAERHLRLRLACAVGNRSAQQIVTDALDAFLNSRPEIDALADRVSRDGTDIK